MDAAPLDAQELSFERCAARVNEATLAALWRTRAKKCVAKTRLAEKERDEKVLRPGDSRSLAHTTCLAAAALASRHRRPLQPQPLHMITLLRRCR